jgi:DNA polymerase I-like protein with 3'-5' exonuclease and polymerase domains
MTTNDANATGPLVWVFDPNGLNGLIEAMRNSAEVVVDLETTGLDEYAVAGGVSNGGYPARIVLASFTLPQEGEDGRWDGQIPVTYVLPLSHPDSPFMGTWKRTFRRVMQEGVVERRRPVNNQNVKFDARWVWAHTGVDLSPFIVWDTQVSSHLLDETKTIRLKGRVPLTFDGVEAWNDFDLSYPGAAEEVPLFELGEYAARDTWWTWRLAQEHKMEMFIDGGGYPEPLYEGRPESVEEYSSARLGPLATWIAMPTVASLTRMENNGIKLDIPWTIERLNVEKARRDEGLDKMAAVFGQDRARASGAATSLWFKDFTNRAVADDRLRIISMTRNGNAQWNKAVLNKNARYPKYNEIATMILEQRGGTKMAEFLESWLSRVRSDGRIHAQYKVGWVSTGRLSSAEPNMQQVSKKLRPAFIPSPGYVMADFDFSQLELRVAAFVARCQPMIDAFHRGDDLHRLLGSYITGKLMQDVTDEERQKAKSANFGLLYLQSPSGYRDYAENVYGVILSMEEAARFHAGFFERWTGMREWHEAVKAKVNRDGYITAPNGRVRRLPGIWNADSWSREEAERQAVNSPVQGFGSDLMQAAAADIQGLLPGTKPVAGVRLVATVHDSLVAELPADSWQEAAAEIKYRMEHAHEWMRKTGVDFDIPLVADVAVGTRWSLSDISNPKPSEVAA